MSKNNTFAAMALSDGMKQSIAKMGFSTATPIQADTIPLLMQGKDVLGQAQTGTGKTAAFGVPVVENIDDSSNLIQALIVCPTRELCIQVSEELKKLSLHKRQLSVVAIYGGQGIELQFRALKRDNPQIVVATPGRLFDHLRRKSISLESIKMIVLDEADEMLDMGFRSEIEEIFELAPKNSQRVFFSATMPKGIKDLACSYLNKPEVIKMDSKSTSSPKIDQRFYFLKPREKTEILCRVLEYHNPKLAVVFCNAKRTVDEMVEELERCGFLAGALHGDLSQAQRDKVMGRFKAGNIQVLIATDVAARGIDIDDVEMVLNFHIPQDAEDYVHRIGRTGRAGRNGLAISFVEPRDRVRLKSIARFANIEIKEKSPPSLEDVKKARFSNFFGKVDEAIKSSDIDDYKKIIRAQKISIEDLAAGMLNLALSKKSILPETIEDEFPSRNERRNRRPNRDGRPFERNGWSSREGGSDSRRKFGRPERRDSFSERAAKPRDNREPLSKRPGRGADSAPKKAGRFGANKPTGARAARAKKA